ncbi:MAG: sulfite exporter TauE/SafE family protein [Magnetococcales bacterium]|nr:sulfite exporter TauE/SafE family protein [Magnetococcales bacterium]
MSISSQLFEFLVVGLLSAIHCLIMCGGIVGALTISLPIQTRQSPKALFEILAIFSLGRLVSYALAGFFAGLFGELLVNTFSLQESHSQILYSLSLVVLVGIGLHIAGWFPEVARLEKVGSRLWRWIEPVAQSLLPVESRFQALILGFLWGWLPCGVTYSVLIWSALLGDSLSGALAMGAFGLGTVPGILMASYFSGRFHRYQKKGLKRGLGILIILLALIFGFLWNPHDLHRHDFSNQQETCPTPIATHNHMAPEVVK